MFLLSCEIAPATHLLQISSPFLLVLVWVDFTRKEGDFSGTFPLHSSPLTLCSSSLALLYQGSVFLGISWLPGTPSWAGQSTMSMVAVGSPHLLWTPGHWPALPPQMPL